MKILVFSSYWRPYISGALTCAGRLTRHWAGCGHQVRVATFRYDPALPAADRDGAVEILRLGGFVRVSKGFVTPRMLTRVWPHVAWADVVLLNLPAFEGMRIALAARLLRRPVVSFLHCRVDLGPRLADRFFSSMLALSGRTQLALSSRIVTHTEDYAEATGLRRRYGARLRAILPPAQPQAADASHLERFHELKAGRRWVGFCGRISREKGIEHLVEAMRLMRDPQAELVLAGPSGRDVAGEDSYGARLSAMLATGRVAHRRIGTLPEEAMGAFYRSLDCLVLPSVNMTEAFGLVQTEAMVHGVPVVASDLPGMRVPVRLTGMGCLASPGDPRSLAAAIARALRARPLEQETAHAREIFDPARFHRAWDELLHEYAE